MAYRPGKCLLPHILRERNLEPYDVYSKIGMTKQQFSDYTTGRRIMSLKTAKTVADQLGIPIDDLYTWEYVPLRGRR